jgi:hypothetical protein
MLGKKNSILFVAALFLSATVSAAPVVWNIDSLIFDDGGTGSGTFIYDADTNAYSSINIVTTEGTDFAGAAYGSVIDFAPNDSDYLAVMVFPLESLPALDLSFAATLTNAGGEIDVIGSGEFLCGQECMYPASDLRYIVSGQVSAVPVPAAVWLFGSALAGLGWMRRRKSV